MKNFKFIILLAFVTLMSCQKPATNYIIKGNIEGLYGPVYLVIDRAYIDTVFTDDGIFEFQGVANKQLVANLATGEGPFTTLFLEGGTTVLVSGASATRNRIKVEGTVANEALNEFQFSKWDMLDLYNMESTTDKQKQQIMSSLDSLYKSLIDNNRDNMAGTYIFAIDRSREMDADIFYEEVAKFSPQMQQTDVMAKASERMAAKKRSAIGQPYIDVALPNQQGDTVKLSSIVGDGKYVLLDFWASWCSPCIGECPYLVEAYDKYHTKGFDIYGVSLDNDKAKWLAAIDEYKMNWFHTSTLEGWDNPATKNYVVNIIPANVLISPEGIIIARNLRGEELKEMLAKLIK